MSRLKTRINRQLSNMPKYTINPEAEDNVAVAASRAFGRPDEIEAAEQAMDQSGVDAFSQAQDVSSSTSALLATLASIEGGKQAARPGLAQTEAAIKSRNVQDLYAAKAALSEEKDKEWYHNVYAPWEAKLRTLKEQKANRNALWSNIAGGLISGAGSFLSGGVNLFGKQPTSPTTINASNDIQGPVV